MLQISQLLLECPVLPGKLHPWYVLSAQKKNRPRARGTRALGCSFLDYVMAGGLSIAICTRPAVELCPMLRAQVSTKYQNGHPERKWRRRHAPKRIEGPRVPRHYLRSG